MNIFKIISHVLVLLLALLVASCARMGRPDGGWYDETPPSVIGATPGDGSVNAKAKKINIFFDEFIKLEDASEKVVVSPPQLEQPEIKATGKRISVELKDSLKANTTYTVDFSDAISDNNEGNPLGNYTYSFSTGEEIDTLEVSGYVVQAENLEPVKGILVGLYAEMADSAFLKMPMLRVARADSRGHFVIRGVAPGTYRIYALNDMDGNYCFSQKSEQIAFSHDTIRPSFTDAVRQDTVWLDSLHIKDITRKGYTRFTPDDIVLRAFNETLTDRMFLKAERSEANRFSLFYSYGSDQLPVLKGLNFNEKDAFIIEPSEKGDTITYWLRDTTLVNQDKRMKQAQKDYEEWKKQEDKKKKKGEPYDSIMPMPCLEPKISAESSLDPDRNIRFDFDTPLASVDTSKIHLYAKHDTLWYTANLRFEPVMQKLSTDSVPVSSLRSYVFRAEWRPGIEYSLEIDSAAFTDIYGTVSRSIKRGIKVRQLDEYGTLLLNLRGMQGKRAVVELLSAQGAPLKRVVTEDGTAQFFYIKPGKYYARLFVDANRNGIWDTGNYSQDQQPEEMYYYPEEMECKAKWDITLDWDPTARPLNEQKPAAITKQKAEQQKKIAKRNMERAKKMGIVYPF